MGCGPGYFSPVLARAVPQGELVLADIQPEMLAIARRRLEKRHITNTTCQLCNGSSFPFADNSFDRIGLVCVLGEIAERSANLPACLKTTDYSPSPKLRATLTSWISKS